MGKSFFKQFGFTIALIQDLFDTVVYDLIKSSKKRQGNRVVNNLRYAEGSYYYTYKNLKKEKGQS
tara:strand:+ start:273 stop:467 length:195 start_codon:yes stop_codon:yes gene_type:complete